ncbi:MAG TPA: hypothetical protein VJU84_01885 [Pyrinomonadaceae bacterium]|nr:hypothetical protein [Pyrinomonadaceae bacterium]
MYIKNVTDAPRQYRMYLKHDAGDYVFPLTTVAPHQTTVVDIRRLRDLQMPDVNGQTIPFGANRGQIQWSMTGGEDRVLIGRSEQADLARGVSSNYACQNCCGNSFYDAWIAPDLVAVFEGFEEQFTAMQQDINCYGQVYPAYQAGIPSFTSTDNSICESTFNGLVTGMGPGSSIINAGWTADAWFMGLNEQCEYTPVEALREAFCNVINPEVILSNAKIHQLSAPFDGISTFTRTATLRVGSSSHGPAICGDDPQEFTIIVNFTLPEGGVLVPSRCTARPESIPDQDYNVVGTPTCVIDDSFFRRGHMAIPARRRCCPASDSKPGIRFVIGANKAGQIGTIDTPGTVKVLCNQ